MEKAPGTKPTRVGAQGSTRNLRPPCPLTYAGLFIVLLFTPTGPATCSMTSALRGASFLLAIAAGLAPAPLETKRPGRGAQGVKVRSSKVFLGTGGGVPLLVARRRR